MFGYYFKILVLILSAILFISNFPDSSCVPRSCAGNGPPAERRPQQAGCGGDCGNSACPANSAGRGKPPPQPKCRNKDCIGRCGRPECQKSEPGQRLERNGQTGKPSGSCGSNAVANQEAHHDAKCMNKQCQGECDKPGCIQNKPENKPKPADGEECPSSNSTSNSTEASTTSTRASCEDEETTPTPEPEPLSGSLDCSKFASLRPPKGPLYTNNAENSKPTTQCTRCNLQIASDGSGVILTCYDCTDVQSVCGGGDNNFNSTISTTTTNCKSTNGNNNAKAVEPKNGKSQSSCANQDNLANSTQKSVEAIEAETNTENEENSTEEVQETGAYCDCLVPVETENAAFTYLVYYIEISNYTAPTNLID